MAEMAVEAAPAAEAALGAEGGSLGGAAGGGAAGTAAKRPAAAKPPAAPQAGNGRSPGNRLGQGTAPRQGQGPARQRQGPKRQSTGKGKPAKWIGPRLTGKASGGLILIEFVAGALIIVSQLFTKGPNKGYLATMSVVIVRMTALTAVFFVLFLLGGSEKTGRAAAWFGLLVDLGIVFTAVTESQFTSLADIFSGAGTGVDDTALTSATNLPEPKPPVTLPDE